MNNPSFDLSIVIPCLTPSKTIEELLHSLQQQELNIKVEVLICASAPQTLKIMPTNYVYRWILLQQKGIAFARNEGLKQAQGKFVLFLDDDVSLPNPQFIAKLCGFFKKSDICGAGGFYLNKQSTSLASRFYNRMCNLWLLNNKDHVLIGGCCAYHREWLTHFKIQWDHMLLGSGEEYNFNKKILFHGGKIQLCPQFSVFHDPQYTWSDVWSRAQEHGTHGQNSSFDQRTSFLKKITTLFKNFQKNDIIFFVPLFLYWSWIYLPAKAQKLLRESHRQLPNSSLSE